MEFAEFYESARDDCLQIVLLNVGDRQLAEDLVAEGFAKVWVSWRKLRNYQVARAWVVRAALNANVRDSLTAAKSTLSETHMNTPLDTIVQRGRATRRRRRLTGLTGTAAVAASAAVVVGLTGSAPAHSTAAVRTAAFTLVSHANRTVTLTINPTELVDAAALQNDLQRYGIPAMVTSGSFCSSDPAPARITQAVSFYPKPTGHFTGIPRGVHPTITFNPAAIPAGAELSFGVFQHSSGEQQTDFALVNSGSYSCTSTPPEGPPANGVQFQTRPR